MTREYRITGNVVEEVEHTIRATLPLPEFLSNLTAYTPYEMMPLPSGLRYLRVAPNEQALKTSLIVQVDPSVHAIRFKNGPASSSRPVRTYNINLPYLFFYFRMNSSTMFGATGESLIWTPEYWGLFWGKEPLTDMEQIVLPSMMPNCYSSGEVCSGSVYVDANDKLGVWVDTAVNTFLTSEFNMDLTYPWPYENMAAWQRATTRDSMDWQNWSQWADVGVPLSQKLGYISSRDWPTTLPSGIDVSPVPEIRNQPTFQAVENWLANITAEDRARLAAGLEAMND